MYFQVCLDVNEKPCLVVGGAEEALEKTERCVEAQAKLTVVSPRLIPELKALIEKNGVRHEARVFQPGDTRGKFFVINSVKTDEALSRSIYEACLAERCLISAYDQPQWSNVTMPYLVRSGKLRVAVSTNAASPGIASKLGKEMERGFDPEFADFVDWVAAYRQKLIQEGAGPDERRAIFREILKDFRMKTSFDYPEQYRQARSGKKP